MEKVPEIFISYAHVDDGPPSGRCQWVRYFRDYLEDFLHQRLGRRDSVTLWRDVGSLDQCKRLTPEIETAVRGSKIFIVLFSEGYRKSEWCRKELELFKEANPGPDGLNGRLFLVKLDDKPPADFDPMLGEVAGFTFFSKSKEEDPVTRLGFPKPDETDKSYFEALNRIAAKLADKISVLSKSSNETSKEGQLPAIKRNPPAGQEVKGRVVLADPTPDLRHYAKKAQSYLEDYGITVLWQPIFGRSIEDYQNSVIADLEQADHFIQILGPFSYSGLVEKTSPVELLQIDLARERRVNISRWRSSGIDIASNQIEEGHKEFITQEDVKAMGFEEFLEEILNDLRFRMRTGITCPNDLNQSTQLLYIDAEQLDQTLATDVGDAITEISKGSMDWEILDLEHSVEEYITQYKPKAILVIYGNCPPQWVKKRCRDLRPILLRQNAKLTGAVLVEPPYNDQKPPLGLCYRKLRVLDGGKKDLSVFIHQVSGEVEP